MIRKLGRYLRWWLSDQYQSWPPYTFLGPFLILFGPVVIVGSAMASDFRTVLGALALFIVGIYIVFFPVFEYRETVHRESADDEPKL